ncbi:unnamed protein product [Linum trigynum]|uniref:Uncharacterized protein n=1 Tax=Linum trigynum TaxID=586398 RepID=A0AAV2FQH9_9ROSI
MEIDNKEVKAQIWDTTAQERFRAVTYSYYRRAFDALVVYDISRKTTFDNVRRWLDELKSKYAQLCSFQFLLFLLHSSIEIDCGWEVGSRSEALN